VSELPEGWNACDPDDIEAWDEKSHAVIAWWSGPNNAAVWVFADGTMEIDVAAPIEVAVQALAAFHQHARGGTAVTT
jgi:hypothetical protein